MDTDDEQFSCNLSDLITRLDAPPILYTPKPPKLLLDRYLIGNQLGQGSYGKVKLCIDTQSKKRLAVKIVTLRLVRKISHGAENVDQEAAALRRLVHDNVTRLYADFLSADGGKRYLVMEWAVCSIHDLQTKGVESQQQTCRYLPESQARHYFSQVLCGVEYLHSMRLVHKDLKPGNLLLTPKQQVKIADFGVCEWLPEQAVGAADDTDDDFITGSQATPAIQPPEVASGCRRFSGRKLDMYCCGVSLYFMVCGRVPYTGRSVLQIYEAITAGKFTVADWVSQPCRQLIVDLMSPRSEARPSVSAARRYDWLVAAASRNDDVTDGSWLSLNDLFQVESEADAVDGLIGDYRRLSVDSANALPVSDIRLVRAPQAKSAGKHRRRCALS